MGVGYDARSPGNVGKYCVGLQSALLTTVLINIVLLLQEEIEGDLSKAKKDEL